MKDFFNLYRHGFARVAVATPLVRVGDPAVQPRRHRRADARGGAREGDRSRCSPSSASRPTPATTCSTSRRCSTAPRTRSPSLLAADARACRWRRSSACRSRSTACSTTAPRSSARGGSLGVVPKTYLPNYREFYEARQFTPGDTARQTRDRASPGQRAPFGADLLFRLADLPKLVLHVEICEDLWVPMPPSSYAALAGATVLANLSASNVDDRQGRLPPPARRQPVGALPRRLPLQRRRAWASRPPTSPGTATRMIYENGTLLAESRRFADAPQLALADVDLERLLADRMRQNTFGDVGAAARGELGAFRTVEFSLPAARRASSLLRAQDRALPLRARRPARRATSAARRSTTSRCRALAHAHARHRHEEAGDRRLGRPRLDPGADRLRARDGRARAAARATSSPTPCPASPPATRTLEPGLAADARGRRDRARRSTSGPRACRC